VFLNRLGFLAFSLSNVTMVVLIAIAIVAVIYILCRAAADWLDERLASLPQESRAAVAGFLSLLLWYGAYCTRNSLRTLRSYSRTTVSLAPLFLLLLALVFWQARKG